MGLKDFKGQEKDSIWSSLNALTASRFAGGIAMGALIASGQIDPTIGFFACLGLGATDGEGIVLSSTNRFPKVQKFLRIFASKFGQKFDPVADKVFAGSIIAGSTVAGLMPHWQAAGIISTEAATSAVTIYKNRMGAETRVSKTGSFGFLARLSTIAIDLGIPAFAASTSELAHAMKTASNITAAAAIGLGAVSCALLSRAPTSSLQPEEIPLNVD